MKIQSLADKLWGESGRLAYLLVASAFILFVGLGARDLWTQEHRWADIVSGMFYRQDFLHPYLGLNRYYDKPLLSYWLMAITAKALGGLTTFALRIPSALSGLLAIWSIYKLGYQMRNKQLGLLAGWMLLTTFYFVFWARTSSADMLNVAGSLFAIAWYQTYREKAKFSDFCLFFIILALTSLCKGLGGAIVALIAVFVDILLRGTFKQYLRLSVFLSVIPALLIYMAPFIASSLVGGNSYGQSGLYMVYRENILRYFQPFDHQGPIYTYFLYLPIYTLPWAVLFLPAIFTVKKRWQHMSLNAKWCAITLLLLFTFFTASGSRRSYYVLPLVPFAILFTADWLLAARDKIAIYLMMITLPLMVVIFHIFPIIYYSQVGINNFAASLKDQAVHIKPWNKWDVVFLDAESKLIFYLGLPPTTKLYDIKGSRYQQTAWSLLEICPLLANKPINTIFVTRKLYQAQLEPFFKGYQIVTALPTYIPFFKQADVNTPIAFIPATA